MKYVMEEVSEKRENFEQKSNLVGTAQISIFDGCSYYKTIKTTYQKRKRELNEKSFEEAFLSIEKEIDLDEVRFPRIKISFEYPDKSRIKILEVREYVLEKIDG